jgi:Flp pilus assembly protein TadB
MTSSAVATPVLLLAAALLVAGGRHGSERLRALDRPPPATDDRPVPALRASWVAIGSGAAGALGWALAGPVAALVVAGAAAGAGAVAHRRLAAGTGPAPEPPGDLAAAWELLAVCLEAGLPVALAVAAAAEPLEGAVGVQLRRIAGLLELGADPAGAWQSAEGLPPVAAFARAAGRSAATGSALASAARAENSRIRAELMESAQAGAQRAGVLITGPLGLCFLPAFLVLGIAPVIAGLAGEALAQW